MSTLCLMGGFISSYSHSRLSIYVTITTQYILRVVLLFNVLVAYALLKSIKLLSNLAIPYTYLSVWQTPMLCNQYNNVSQPQVDGTIKKQKKGMAAKAAKDRFSIKVRWRAVKKICATPRRLALACRR